MCLDSIVAGKKVIDVAKKILSFISLSELENEKKKESGKDEEE